MADPFEVHLVATDREIWTGQASMVTFSTHEGSVGVMPGHSPLMGMLRDGPVLIRQVEGGDLHAAVHEGFVVVDDGKVMILAETAELAEEIDLERAKVELEYAESTEDSESKTAAVSRAEVRIKVAQRSD